MELNWFGSPGLGALHNFAGRIGVFFYRGDSSEGGSGTPWLAVEDEGGHMHDILARLVDGGLIVTDGSNGMMNDHVICRHYGGLSRFLYNRDVTPLEAMQQSNAFTGPLGHKFECVGCVDCICPDDKGPTLIWQVCRSSAPT